MGMYAADGSLNIATDTGLDGNGDYAQGKGIFSKSGGLRVNTTSTKRGVYAEDGALRGSISNNEASPAAGTGAYGPSGNLRMTVTGSAYYVQPGVYAKDGSLKVTVTNAA